MRRIRRTQSGILLIETLVAMLIGTIMSLAIISLLAQSLRISTATSNQMMADQIANSVFETLKQYNFATVVSFNGQTIPLKINRVVGDSPGPSAENIALGLDLNSLTWTTSSISNGFPGTATLQISQGTIANTEQAVVNIQWADSSKLTTHTATYTTVINGGGEDNWY